MFFKRFLKLAVLGLCISIPPLAVAPVAQAETIRVVKSGTAADLNVPMNRAVVVESDVPFSELSIANPAIADISSLSDRTIYVLGKSPGLTTLTLLDASDRLIANVDVRVAADISEFKESLRQILPGEEIEVRTANDGIVLSGTVSSSARLQRALDLADRYAPERVSNLMTVGGVQQVMLKVRFAEMQRSVSKSLSSSLALNGTGFNGDLAINSGTGTNNTAGGVSTSLAGVIPSNNTNAGAVLFGFSAGSTQVGLLLEALETKGVVHTLAEPNLVALSGQEAKFLAGGEYPVPVSQENGTITVEFKPFGIELNFIPRVVDQGLVNLELEAAVSAIDPTNGFSVNGFEIDAFSRRETSTTVEMGDGESFAIAGLLQDDFVMGHPVLSDGLLDHLGPAVSAGRSVLLYGPPGNGKSSISNGIRRALGDSIYVPRAIEHTGQVITVYDPLIHVRTEAESDDPTALRRSLRFDTRYVRCARPTLVTGGS